MPRPARVSNLAGRGNEKEKKNTTNWWKREEEEEEERVWCCWERSLAMNQAQGLFVLAFLSTVAVLVAAAYVVSAKLAAAGYDVSRLILIGLDRNPRPTMPVNTAYAQFIALALAVASSVFIYVKFAASPSSSPSPVPLSPSRSERAPVLNPKEFQEFALKEKIDVSPNTAMFVSSSSRPSFSSSPSPVTALHCLVQTTSLASPSASTSPFQQT